MSTRATFDKLSLAIFVGVTTGCLATSAKGGVAITPLTNPNPVREFRSIDVTFVVTNNDAGDIRPLDFQTKHLDPIHPALSTPGFEFRNGDTNDQISSVLLISATQNVNGTNVALTFNGIDTIAAGSFFTVVERVFTTDPFPTVGKYADTGVWDIYNYLKYIQANGLVVFSEGTAEVDVQDNPEPSTIVSSLIGTAVLAGFASRRKRLAKRSA